MSQLDDLLNRSRAPGKFIERRRFTLSRDKAIDKLREFSLRNPRQYVLELVQSAVFAGATYVAIDVDPDHLLLAWVGGKPFTPTELEGVFDFLFADRGERSHRHLVQLAVGLNALLQRKPKVLRIESGDGTIEGTVRMDLDKSGKGVLGRPEDPLAGTYILAEFGTNWFQRFQGNKWTPEAGLVEENCRFTPVPILLNGRAPFGYKASRRIRMHGVSHSVHFDEDPADRHARRGVLAVTPKTGRSGIHVVVGGVRVSTLSLPQIGILPFPESGGVGSRELSGVLCDDSLRKTADQSDIVQDARFGTMLRAIQPHATRLIREVAGTSYKAPELPHFVADAPSSEPLPEIVPQLGGRSRLPADAIDLFADELPMFWVRPEDVDAVTVAADPLRFPYPVLVLSDGQVETLDELFPSRAVHRLATAADVDFVRRVLERRVITIEREIPWTGETGGTLRLRATLDGPEPAWGDPQEGDLPVLIAHKGHTIWAGHLPLGLAGVSVELDLDQPWTGDPDSLAAQVADVALDEAWRLLPDSDSVPVDVDMDARELSRALRPMAISLLAAHIHPHFVAGDSDSVAIDSDFVAGDSETRLDAYLPVAWGARASRFRDLPLADTTEGPLTLTRLLDLQGTDRVLELLDPTDLARLEPLERRLGVGHLTHPALDRVGGAVVRMPHGWQWWGDRPWTMESVTHAVWVGPRQSPKAGQAEWRTLASPISAVGRAARDDASADSDWAAGYALLYRNLLRMAYSDDWVLLTRSLQGAESRMQHVARLALLQLAGQGGTLAKDGLYRTAGHPTWRPITTLLTTSGFAVAPRHGPDAPDEPDVLLLTLDELRATESGLDQSLTLRFDDPPEVWQSLSDPTNGDWLIRQKVDIPGLNGWLGLRLPYDDTTGVLLQTTGAMLVLSAIDRVLPCHGLLRLTGGQIQPSRMQTELLQLARHQLYQGLLGVLADRVTADRMQAARQYGMLFAVAAWRDTRGRLEGTAAEIARRVTVTLADGQEWGPLTRWLSAPVQQRPPLPVRLRSTVVADIPHEDLTKDERFLAHLEGRLLAAGGAELADSEIVVQTDYGGAKDPLVAMDDRSSSPGLAVLVVNLSQGTGFALTEGNPHASELVLLEMARLLCLWRKRTGGQLDLLEMQRVLVGQRLVGG